jgi:capsular exopolysaccharide synthesis family protein
MREYPPEPTEPNGAEPLAQGGRRGDALSATNGSPDANALVMQNDGAMQARYYATAQQEDEINLWDYVNVLLRRRWTVTAVFAVCVLSALVLSFAATPMYTAAALLQIQPGGPNVTDFDSVQDSMTQSQAYYDFFQTQYDLLSSRTLARRTIDELRLQDNEFINGDLARQALLLRAKAWVGSLLPVGDEPDSETAALERERRMVDHFIEQVKIDPRRKSFLVELSFTSPDPKLSRDIAETMADQYIDLTLDQSVNAAAQARDFIAKQVAKTKASLEASEEALQTYARGKNIHALEQEERVIHERLAELNSLLTEAEANRIALGVLHDQTRAASHRELGVLVNDDLIKRMREELAQLEAKRAERGARFTDEYPEVRELDARITRQRASIEEEEDRVVASVQSDYRRATQREDQLRAQLDQQKQVVAAYEQKAIDFKIQQREVDTNRQIYENLLLRMKEVEVTEAIRASNISLVDRAETPLEPSSPKIPLNLALSMMLGLFGGIGIAFFQEYMDDTLKTPDDVERYLRLATLGTIPEFNTTREKEATDDKTPDLEVAQQPTSAGSEAIRTLRASLFLAAPGGLPTRLLLTSARPSEGKTCIAVNLATALAQLGRKVCLIDCDLRRPRVNKALATSLTPGLTNHLAGNMTLDQIIRPSGQQGLDVITAGPIPPNPVDLLDSANMARLLRELEERYDHILVDAPPALGFADVPIITNQLGGGCLLVTRSGETSKRLAKQACDYLIRMQSKLLGVVLNRVATNRVGYSYYGYYGYYGDYYAKREEDESLPQVESAA